jgi:hypothetical protein
VRGTVLSQAKGMAHALAFAMNAPQAPKREMSRVVSVGAARSGRPARLAH